MGQKINEILDVIMGFRKFIAFLLVTALSVIFLMDGKINGGNFSDILKNSFLGFAAANGVEHFTLMARDFIASKTGNNGGVSQ